MRVSELKPGVRYYLPGDRYWWFVKSYLRTWGGKTERIYQFKDVIGCVSNLSVKTILRLEIRED